MLPLPVQTPRFNSRPKSPEENYVIYGFRGGVMPEVNNGLPRIGHTIVMYKNDMYLFGGYGPKNVYSSEIFCNVKMTLQWKELHGIGLVPSGRANHTAIVCGNRMIVLGGNRNLEVFEDLYILNLDTLRWERIVTERGQGPGPIFSHSAVYVPPTNSMFVIGGFHQRHHNMYIGHALDIRHLVWKGICAPASVNPQHIQLCSAVYHPQTTSLVVIGIVNRDVLCSPPVDNPIVFVMNVFTGVWVEVTTPASPDSPIPFQMGGVWEYFAREALTMGGVYDEKRQEWYFPMLMSPIDGSLMRRKTYDRSVGLLSTTSTMGDCKYTKKKASYGVLKFHLADMTWSLVPVRFPKRVIQELTTRKNSKLGAALERIPRRRRSKEIIKTEPSLLFSPDGVSRFQHKYAYAIIEPSGAFRQSSGKRVFMMHGGVNPDDYAMLLFTPIVKRKQNPQEGYVAFSESNEVSLSVSRVNSFDQSAFAGDDDGSESESEFSRILPDTAMSKLKAEFTAKVGRLHRLESDPTLLPSIPSPYRHNVSHRFAVMYHNLSGMQNDKLVPDSGCPVAVLDKESDVKAWAQNFYNDSRRWIAKNVKTARVEDRMVRRRARRHNRSGKSDVNGEDLSSESDSETSAMPLATTVAAIDMKQTSPEPEVNETVVRDFLFERGLELFDLEAIEMGRASGFDNLPFFSHGATPTSIRRLCMTVKRNEEVQRLPASIFQRASMGNITDLGGAMAYLLMQSAIKQLEGDTSAEGNRRRARIRWKYVSRMVLNGEAAAIVHRANLDEYKSRGFEVSSTSQLALAPDLHTRGVRPRRVPTRPVPYTVPKALSHVVRASAMTPIAAMRVQNFGKATNLSSENNGASAKSFTPVTDSSNNAPRTAARSSLKEPTLLSREAKEEAKNSARCTSFLEPEVERTTKTSMVIQRSSRLVVSDPVESSDPDHLSTTQLPNQTTTTTTTTTITTTNTLPSEKPQSFTKPNEGKTSPNERWRMQRAGVPESGVPDPSDSNTPSPLPKPPRPVSRSFQSTNRNLWTEPIDSTGNIVDVSCQNPESSSWPSKPTNAVPISVQPPVEAMSVSGTQQRLTAHRQPSPPSTLSRATTGGGSGNQSINVGLVTKSRQLGAARRLYMREEPTMEKIYGNEKIYGIRPPSVAARAAVDTTSGRAAHGEPPKESRNSAKVSRWSAKHHSDAYEPLLSDTLRPSDAQQQHSGGVDSSITTTPVAMDHMPENFYSQGGSQDLGEQQSLECSETDRALKGEKKFQTHIKTTSPPITSGQGRVCPESGGDTNVIPSESRSFQTHTEQSGSDNTAFPSLTQPVLNNVTSQSPRETSTNNTLWRQSISLKMRENRNSPHYRSTFGGSRVSSRHVTPRDQRPTVPKGIKSESEQLQQFLEAYGNPNSKSQKGSRAVSQERALTPQDLSSHVSTHPQRPTHNTSTPKYRLLDDEDSDANPSGGELSILWGNLEVYQKRLERAALFVNLERQRRKKE